MRQFSLAISIVFYTVSCIMPGGDNLVQLYQQYFTLFHVSGLDKTIQSSYINSILHCFMYQGWIRQFSLAISIAFYTVSCIRPGLDNLVQLYQQHFTLFHVSGLDQTIQSSYINSILHCFMCQAWIRQFSLAISIAFYTVSCIRPGLDNLVQLYQQYFTLFHVSGLDKTIQSSYINSILHCFMYQGWIRQFSLAISIAFYTVSCIRPGLDNLVQLYQQYFTLFHVSGLDKSIQSSYINSILHCFLYQAWIIQFSLAISIVFYTVSCIRSWIRQFSLAISISFYTVSCIYQPWIRQFSLAISIVFYTASCDRPG